MRDEVQALGCAFGEDQVVRILHLQEASHGLARRLEPVGAALAQIVDAAVHVGIVVLIDVADGVDHLPRRLRGGRRVEKYQWLAIDLAAEDREVGADGLHVEIGPRQSGCGRVHRAKCS